MWEELPIRQLHFRTHFSNCACRCRFCCLGDYCHQDIRFRDYAEIVSRFIPYGKVHGIKIRSYVYNSLEYKELAQHLDLCRKLGTPESQLSYFDINGTHIRSGKELYEWIEGLKALGMTTAGITWFGNESYHDMFVSRRGYYEYLENVALALRERGVRVKSKIFLTPNMTEQALDVLHHVRSLSDLVQFGMTEYTGFAKQEKSLFLAASDFKLLPTSIKEMFGSSFSKTFKTEKEWIDLVKSQDYPQFSHRDLLIYVDKSNLHELASSRAEDIIAKLNEMDKRLRSACSSLDNLACEYGDSESTILLEWRDVVRKWISKCYLANNLDMNDLFSLTNSSIEWKVTDYLYTNDTVL